MHRLAASKALPGDACSAAGCVFGVWCCGWVLFELILNHTCGSNRNWTKCVVVYLIHGDMNGGRC